MRRQFVEQAHLCSKDFACFRATWSGRGLLLSISASAVAHSKPDRLKRQGLGINDDVAIVSHPRGHALACAAHYLVAAIRRISKPIFEDDAHRTIL